MAAHHEQLDGTTRPRNTVNSGKIKYCKANYLTSSDPHQLGAALFGALGLQRSGVEEGRRGRFAGGGEGGGGGGLQEEKEEEGRRGGGGEI